MKLPLLALKACNLALDKLPREGIILILICCAEACDQALLLFFDLGQAALGRFKVTGQHGIRTGCTAALYLVGNDRRIMQDFGDTLPHPRFHVGGHLLCATLAGCCLARGTTVAALAFVWFRIHAPLTYGTEHEAT
jgi:hypothetical protein